MGMKGTKLKETKLSAYLPSVSFGKLVQFERT